MKIVYAVSPRVKMRVLDKIVRDANIINKDKCGFTCVTSKTLTKTKHKAANPNIHAINIERGCNLDNRDCSLIRRIIGEKQRPENKYNEKL